MRHFQFDVHDTHYQDNQRTVWFQTPDKDTRIITCGDWEYVKEIADLAGSKGIRLIPTMSGSEWHRTEFADKWERTGQSG